MLAVSRNVGQWIRIGDDVEICLLNINNHHSARIGIVAPREMRVSRTERQGDPHFTKQEENPDDRP